jgi:hypothetical protein
MYWKTHVQCKLCSDIGCNTENYTELSADKFIHVFRWSYQSQDKKMYTDKMKYISGTQIQGLLGIQGNSFCFYLNSLSMVSKNVDSNNRFVKLWIRWLDEVII